MFRIILILAFPLFGYSQEIALTFDDAPTENGQYYTGNERTEKIIRHLKDNNVSQAAFFVITTNIQNDAGLSRLNKYVKAGHFLANHTHTHQWIHNIGTENYIADVSTADSILRKIPGYLPFFRYPFLDEGRTRSARDSIRSALQKLGLANGYVTVDNYDWYLNGQVKKALQNKKQIDETGLRQIYIEHIWTSIQFYDNVAKKILGRSPKHVLLLHENDLTAKFLGDLIKHIKANGWKIIPATEAFKDPISGQVPDVLFNGQGRVAAIAREKGTLAKDLVQSSEDEEFLDRLILEKKIFQ
jgi:peptidoglycan-N-acetylglucosamine deacetylase